MGEKRKRKGNIKTKYPLTEIRTLYLLNRLIQGTERGNEINYEVARLVGWKLKRIIIEEVRRCLQ